MKKRKDLWLIYYTIWETFASESFENLKKGISAAMRII